MLYVIVFRKVRVKHKKYARAYVKTVYDVTVFFLDSKLSQKANVREFRFLSFP